jgi:DNA processing protein
MRLRRIIDSLGNVELAWNATRKELRDTGLGKKYIDELIDKRTQIDLDSELKKLAAEGVDAITWDDERYPARLKEIDSPPPVLYARGKIESVDRYAVAIVGTRRLSPYGRAIAHEISAGLAANGITIVSGLARGIDGIAHRAAIGIGGRTLAVLGSGLDRIYPPEHQNLAAEITQHGAVLSDYPLGTPPEGRNFPPRNRIISGLSLAVIVVEAGESSGALITANFAAEHGREVFAVPGSIQSKASKGTNRLILNGATPYLSINDVLEALNLELIARQEHVEDFLPDDEVEGVIYGKLTGDPIHVDDLQVECGLPVSVITATLSMLELKGRARRVGGMNYVKIGERVSKYRVE